MSAAIGKAAQGLVSEGVDTERREEKKDASQSREMTIFVAAAAGDGEEKDPPDVKGRGKKGFADRELLGRVIKITLILVGLAALGAAAIGIAMLLRSHPQQDQLQCRSSPPSKGPQNVLADQSLLPHIPTDDDPEERANTIEQITQPAVEHAKAANAVWGRLDAYNKNAYGQDLNKGATQFVEQDVACLTGLPYTGTPVQAALAGFLKLPFLPTPDLLTPFMDVRALNLQFEPEIDDELFVKACKEFLRLNEKCDNGDSRVTVSSNPTTGTSYAMAKVNFSPLVDQVNRVLKPFSKVQNIPAITEIASIAAPYELGPVNLAALSKATTMEQIRGLENLFEAAVARFRQGEPVPTEGGFIFKVKDALGMLRYTQATGIVRDPNDDWAPITTLTQSAPSIFIVLYDWFPDWAESITYKIQNLYWAPMLANVGRVNSEGHSYTLEDVREVGFVALQTARGLHGTWSYREGSATPFQYNLTAEITFFEQQLQQLA